MINKQNSNLQKITNILNNFLEPFECTTEIDTDFAYYTASNIINYAFRNDNFNSINCSFIRKNNIKYYNVFFL